jgi:hypothetical protein
MRINFGKKLELYSFHINDKSAHHWLLLAINSENNISAEYLHGELRRIEMFYMTDSNVISVTEPETVDFQVDRLPTKEEFDIVVKKYGFVGEMRYKFEN